MKLLSIQESTITSLFMLGNSRAKRNLINAATKLVERYQFKKMPTLDELASTKQVFQIGMFEDEQIDTFEIYSDGVVVKSGCHSDVLEAFLANLNDWVESELGFERIETHSNGIAFSSEVLVEMAPEVFAALDSYNVLASNVTRLLSRQSGRQFKLFSAAGVMFAPNDPDLSGLKPVPFRLERKLSTDFSKNIFYSSAPLKTKDHLEVLRKLEEDA